MVSVGLFTDEPVVSQGLSHILESSGQFRFVPLECTPEQLLVRLKTVQLDVLLVDFSDRTSFSWLATLRGRFPDCRILLWVREPALQLVHQVYQLGFRGIVRKNLKTGLLVRCFRAVAAGELWYERSMMQALHDSETVKLTRRETQLLTLVGQGFTNKEIASELSLTEGTVKFYMSRLFRKMGVGDRFELALYGLKMLHHDGRASKPPSLETLSAQGPRSIVLDARFMKSA